MGWYIIGRNLGTTTISGGKAFFFYGSDGTKLSGSYPGNPAQDTCKLGGQEGRGVRVSMLRGGLC